MKQEIQRNQNRPVLPIVTLAWIVAGCLCSALFLTKDPACPDLEHYNMAPCAQYLFGTDTLGRDIFSMIWSGGRISLWIGIVGTLLSVTVAVLFGTISASLPAWADALLMRMTEILLSVPGILPVMLLQAILGQADVKSIAFVIGITGWMSMAKVVRARVRQIRNSEYVLAARCMGGGFFYVLWRHLAPNVISSVLFMAIMNIRTAILTEATLGFMGIGLPAEIISWGSMLSLADQAMFGGSWWIVLFPGGFLIITLSCITSIGNYMQACGETRERNI